MNDAPAIYGAGDRFRHRFLLLTTWTQSIIHVLFSDNWYNHYNTLTALKHYIRNPVDL